MADGNIVDDAGNSAGSGVNVLLQRILLRLLVFQRQLVPHLVGDLLLHLGRKRCSAVRIVNSLAAFLLRGIGCL